jgi:tetratricopeptide (TPR) repeat protein
MQSPLVGHGPGTFAREFLLSGYNNTYSQIIPHAHNASIQTLVEGGIVGLAAIALICGAVLRAMWHTRKVDWAPAAAITFFALAVLTDNLSVNAFVIAPLIVWIAIACPRSDSRVESTERARYFAAAYAAAILIGLATAATLAGAWRYDTAASEARDGNHAAVISRLREAVALDPAFPMYHRDLGVWLLAAGDIKGAENELATAIRLNPADLQARRAAAVAYAAGGNQRMALDEAKTAAAINSTQVENALTLAYVEGLFGNIDGERAALVEALRIAPWLTAAPEWRILFPDAEPSTLFRQAFNSWATDQGKSRRNLQARAWLAGLIRAPAPSDANHVATLETEVLSCDPGGAIETLAAMTSTEATHRAGLVARILYERALGDEKAGTTATLLELRDRGLGQMARLVAFGSSPAWDYSHDLRYYARFPIPPPSGITFPTQASGMSAWLRDPAAAADTGAPGSELAACT